MELFDYDIYQDRIENISKRNLGIISTINPHSYVMAKSDMEFQKALKQSDILLPDGIGIVLAVQWLKRKRIKKISGSDIHQYLLHKAALETNSRVFYLGSSENTLNKIKARIEKEYEGIQVATYSPPFKDCFTKDENQRMIDQINLFNPHILFVGMTAPKQEKWVHQNAKKMKVETIVSIGAVFDFYAGTIERSSQFWIDIGLEWLPRFLKEPKRLWRRNFISSPLFLKDIFISKLSNYRVIEKKKFY